MRAPSAPRAAFAAIAVAACALALAGPARGAGAADPPPPRLRAAQILLFRGGDAADVEASLRRLRDAGVDTVIVRAFQNRGDRPLLFTGAPGDGSGVYFPTAAAPVVADHLGLVSAVCRRLGLSVFAWMTTRASDWLLEERPDLAELRYDGAVGQVLPSGRVNVFHPAARRRLRALFADLARADIDGILFQDDLVLRSGEGLSPRRIEAYLAAGGPAVAPSLLFERPSGAGEGTVFSPALCREAFWPWATWKNRALLDLAEELMAAAREVRPGLRFALNLHYEAVLNPRMALAWYAQDLAAARRRSFDYFSLMSYHRQIGRELSFAPEEAVAAIGVLSRQAAAAAGDPARVIVKVQALDWETAAPIPAEELDRALGAAAPGVSLAFVRALDDPPLQVIRQHFR